MLFALYTKKANTASVFTKQSKSPWFYTTARMCSGDIAK